MRSVQPVRIVPADLDNLVKKLEVEVVALTECLVAAGYSLHTGGFGAPGIHYNIHGTGRMKVAGLVVDLKPHTLVIVPAGTTFEIEACDASGALAPLRSVDARLKTTTRPYLRRLVAGEGEPQIILICGYFQATYGASLGLFSRLRAPIVEQFGEGDDIGTRLRWVLEELVEQEVASGAMTASLMKQVIVTIIRRSLENPESWFARFALLSDPQVAVAFSVMTSSPGEPHTVAGLARRAGLGRSTFMRRFTDLVGASPMAALRDIRLNRAADDLRNTDTRIDSIAKAAGYASRSSFARVFRSVFGKDPSAYRADAQCGTPAIPGD